MTLNRESVPPIYAVTNAGSGRSHLEIVQELLSGGAQWIQLREKDLPDSELFQIIVEIVSALPAQAKLFINDRVDLALAAMADGVHLGDRDLPPAAARVAAGERRLIVGTSTHDLDQAIVAAEDPAVDYVALGPIFESPTKRIRAPIGLEPLRRLRAVTNKPIVAIGGIHHRNVRSVLEAGADSVAVISALYQEGSISDNLSKLSSAVESAR